MNRLAALEQELNETRLKSSHEKDALTIDLQEICQKLRDSQSEKENLTQ
jgi:hypothetical protein